MLVAVLSGWYGLGGSALEGLLGGGDDEVCVAVQGGCTFDVRPQLRHPCHLLGEKGIPVDGRWPYLSGVSGCGR